MSSKVIFWDNDTQKDLINPDGKLYVQDAENIKENLSTLTQYAHLNGIRILGSIIYHSITDPEIDEEIPDYKETFPPHCLMNEPGSERIMETRSEISQFVDPISYPEDKVTEVIETKGPIIFRKTKFDVFSNPNIDVFLDRINPKKIVIYGVAADLSLKHSIEGLLKKKKYELFLVIDAIEGFDENSTRELIEKWASQEVTTLTTEAILQGDYLK